MHWRRKWQPTPVLLPGESQGQGSLVGYRLWGHTELDTTLQLNNSNTPKLLKRESYQRSRTGRVHSGFLMRPKKEKKDIRDVRRFPDETETGLVMQSVK